MNALTRAAGSTLVATFGLTAGAVALLVAAWPATTVRAADRPPIGVERQNAFVKSHCAVCHSNRATNGGLSLEGFDAAEAAPSLAAMMLSKITSGTALATVHAAAHDQAAAAILNRGLGKGAINAAGVGVPDRDTVDGLVAAFTEQSARAARWSVERSRQPATGAEVATASIVRELATSAAAGRPADIEAAMYRLVLTCNAVTREGTMQLAWSPLPKEGTLSVAVDGKPAVTYTVAGKERMGNGGPAVTGPAAFVFARTNGSAIELPSRTLTASGLFTGETVTFPFDELDQPARQALSACFR